MGNASDIERSHQKRLLIGLALSGGGHRAALFSVGALMALVDARLNRDVVSVASVSGGSITNGVVAHGGDYSTMSPEDLESAIKTLMRTVSRDDLFFPGTSTDGYLGRVFWLLGVALAAVSAGLTGLTAMDRHWPLAPWTVAIAAACGVVVALLVAVLLRTPRRGHLAVGLLATIPLCMLAVAATRDVHGLAALPVAAACVLLPAATFVLWVIYVGRRSQVVDDALDETLFAGAALASTNGPVHHVYCTTDLRTADHAYFSPRLVYGYDLGLSAPAASLRLSTVVQASACLPGAFAPRRLRARDVASSPLDTEHVVVTDGGVHDNMADQWELGWANRRRELAKRRKVQLSDYQIRRADALVAVNAGGIFKTRPLRGRGPIVELTSLVRARDIMYDATTTTRRRYLVHTFRNSDTSIPGRTSETLAGTLIHINQTPFTVADFLTGDSDDALDSARQARRVANRIAELDGLEWEQVRNTTAAVRTSLGPVPATVAANIVQHAYVLTRINVYLNLGLGEMPASDADLDSWRLARFTALLTRQ